jgi:hypothetical protein
MIKAHRYLALPIALLMLGCQTSPPLGSDWIETQMYFGLTQGGTRISDANWHDFVDRSITPRFPDGLTIQYGDGQYRTTQGDLHKEPTAILTILHPPGDDEKLNQIAREYDQRFHQESVLRADFPARTAFIATSLHP